MAGQGGGTMRRTVVRGFVEAAIEDALAPLGVRITDQYLPPTKILELAGVIEPD